MRSANKQPEKEKQRYLPTWLRWRMDGYTDILYNREKTIEKIKAYIEKHRHHPEYLNALRSPVYSGCLLRWAYSAQKMDIVELMLSCDGVNVNMLDNSPESVFHYALRHMDTKFNLSFVRACVNYPGVDVTSPMVKYGREENDAYVYPLTMALEQHGTLDIAKKILEHDGHSELSLSYALKIAINRDYLEIVTLLLKKGVVIDESHLVQAMDAGHDGIVAALLNHKSFVVDPHSRMLIDALQRAAWGKTKYGIVKLFVDRKLDVDVPGIFPRAAKKKWEDIVETILARDDFDANVVFKDNHSNLTELITMPCPLGALRLLECRKEVLVNAHVAGGETALILAAGLKQNDVMAALLARADIEIDAQNDSGETALYRAAANDNSVGITDLLSHGANPNIPNINGETPLIVAIKNNHADCVAALLINSKIDLTLADIHGKSALMYAAEMGMRQVVKLLLEHDDSNVNAQDNNGDTALILSARAHDDANIIESLLAHGADDGIRNERSHTALMVAESHHRSLCPLLTGYMVNRYQYQMQEVPSAPPLSIVPSAPPIELTDAKYDPSFFAPPVFRGDDEKSASAALKP